MDEILNRSVSPRKLLEPRSEGSQGDVPGKGRIKAMLLGEALLVGITNLGVGSQKT
jgi:hypothetical protein